MRRGHLLDDDAVHDFYDAGFRRTSCRPGTSTGGGGTPSTTSPGAARAHRRRPARRRRAVIRLADYPDTWRTGELDVPLAYRFAPGEPLDGVTLRVPLTALNQVDEATLDWQIPGYRDELVQALVRTLPKDVRRDVDPTRRDSPAPRPSGSVLPPAASSMPWPAAITEVSGVDVGDDFEPAARRRRICACTSRARRARQGPRRRHGPRGDPRPPRLGSTRGDRRRRPLAERTGITTWDLGTLPPNGRRRAGRPPGDRLSGAARRRRQRVAAHRDQSATCNSG